MLSPLLIGSEHSLAHPIDLMGIFSSTYSLCMSAINSIRRNYIALGSDSGLISNMCNKISDHFAKTFNTVHSKFYYEVLGLKGFLFALDTNPNENRRKHVKFRIKRNSSIEQSPQQYLWRAVFLSTNSYIQNHNNPSWIQVTTDYRLLFCFVAFLKIWKISLFRNCFSSYEFANIHQQKL